jgi:hypothetical protein
MGEPTARIGAEARQSGWERAQGTLRREGRPIALGLTIVVAAVGIGLFVLAGNHVGWTRTWFDDLAIYQAATRRLLAGDSWYLAHQLAGPYQILDGDVLYPPVTAWFFLPWLILPAWTFVLVPLGIIARFLVSARPAAWTWPLMALCLAYPVTLIYIVYANPTVWITAFVALGLRYAWPGVFVLLKPTLAPFALIGIRTRGWWIGLVVLGLASLPFLGATLDYPRILLDSRGGGLLYSAISVPLALVPLIAWIGRRRPPNQTRPDAQ